MEQLRQQLREMQLQLVDSHRHWDSTSCFSWYYSILSFLGFLRYLNIKIYLLMNHYNEILLNSCIDADPCETMKDRMHTLFFHGWISQWWSQIEKIFPVYQPARQIIFATGKKSTLRKLKNSISREKAGKWKRPHFKKPCG